MSAGHYYLCGPAFPEPVRWREAFPDGAALRESALIEALQRTDPADCLTWLSTSDIRWHAHLRQVLQIHPTGRVVLLTGVPDDREGLRAINEGARGYAHAYAVPALLQEVALVVLHGGLWVGPSLIGRLLTATQVVLARQPGAHDADGGDGATAWASLSAREAQVARAVAAGRSNKEVAALLFISERTVKAHLGAVFEKLGVRDRLQLALRLAAPTLDPVRDP